MKKFFVSLALAAMLVPPCAAQSDTAKPKILLKAEIVLIRHDLADMVDMSHVNFDILPLSPSTVPSLPSEDQKMLEYAVGYPVILLHQKLLQKTPVTEITETVFSQTPVSAADNAPVTIMFNQAVPDPSQPDLTYATPPSLPHIKRMLVLEGSLTFIPHINPNKTIMLDLSLPSDPDASPQDAAKQFRLRPVSSGDPILIRNFFLDTGNRAELSSAILLRLSKTLLIFVTPTFAPDSK